MTRVAVIGSRGQLGGDLVRVLQETRSFRVIPLTHDDIEVTDAGSVQAVLQAARPDVVVNCAAFVRVDDCEDRPEEAFRVNALGALHVARTCAELQAACIHISTDYVFDGEKDAPYNEEDPPRPVNVYGASKLAGEYLVRQACPRWLIVRVSALFGKTGASARGGNFVEIILAKGHTGEPLRVVHDVRISPTYTVDAAQALSFLLEQDVNGVFHLANAGGCSWYEFARAALDLCGMRIPVEPIESSSYPARARRPAASVLTSIRLPTTFLPPLRPWRDALRAYLLERRHIS